MFSQFFCGRHRCMTPEMLQVRAFFKNLFKYLRRCIITPMQVIKFNFLSDTFLAAAQHFHFFFGRGGGGINTAGIKNASSMRM